MSKIAVFTFGRFQPVTKGHKKVVELVYKLARERQGEAFVFPSATHDSTRNPIPFDTKVALMRKVFTGVIIVQEPTIITPFHATGYLGHKGFTDLVFVVGSDRLEEFKRRFSKPLDYFQSFELVEAGSRTDNDDISQMSGTLAREAAQLNDIQKFRKVTGWDMKFAEQLMSATRQGMKNNGN